MIASRSRGPELRAQRPTASPTVHLARSRTGKGVSMTHSLRLLRDSQKIRSARNLLLFSTARTIRRTLQPTGTAPAVETIRKTRGTGASSGAETWTKQHNPASERIQPQPKEQPRIPPNSLPSAPSWLFDGALSFYGVDFGKMMAGTGTPGTCARSIGPMGPIGPMDP